MQLAGRLSPARASTNLFLALLRPTPRGRSLHGITEAITRECSQRCPHVGVRQCEPFQAEGAKKLAARKT